jgi:CHAD domain-containing protein
MPYAFQKDESIDAAVRRVMDEQIVRAREQLTDESSPREKRIHNARKRFKEIRALLRLVREPLGAHFSIENAWFRDAGRDLAAVRDADAVIEALDKLELQTAVRNRLHKQLASAREPLDLDALIANTVSQLAIAQGRIALWPRFADSFDTLAPGLGRTYRDGRRARKGAHDAHELHEWRKHVKTHWYHVQLLEPLWPEMLKEYSSVLHNLSQLLGDHHDLHVLRERVQGAPRDVAELMGMRQSFLEQQAHAIGNRVYAERTPQFVSRIGKWWSAWR